MSPAGNEKQVDVGAALPARGKIHGPLRDTAPQRVRSFLEAPTRAGIRLRLQSNRETPGGSISPSPAAHGRLAADSAGAPQSAHRGGGTERRVLGPLARPITRMQPPPASASKVALAALG